MHAEPVPRLLIAARRSATPEVTALTGRKGALVVVAMMRASVVLPEPGGPQRMIDESRSASIALRSSVPGPTTCSWPDQFVERARAHPGRERAREASCCAGWLRTGPLQDHSFTIDSSSSSSASRVSM